MFDAIGKKIMNVAKVFFWIGIIGFGILGVSMIVSSQSVYNKTESLQMLTSGITIIVAGFVGSWIGSICLYGFGKLIDDNDKNRSLLERLAADNNKQFSKLLEQIATNIKQASNSSPVQKKQPSIQSSPEKQQSNTVVSAENTNLYVDPNICIGCEMCVSTCPELFKMENDKATVISDMTPETWTKGNEAIDNCPVQAISEK